MSTLKVNNLQVGQDGTAANNYTLYQPASPDGTVRLGYGVAGSVTDILTLKNSRLGIGTANPEEDLHIASNSPYILLDDIDNSQKWKLKGTAWFAIEDTTSGVDRLRIGSAGQIGLGGANYGTSGQVLTSGGPGSAVTWSTIPTPDADKITEGNTEAEVVDTGSDGHFKVTTEGVERLRIASDGNIGIGTNNPSVSLDLASNTDAVSLPTGTTAQRPSGTDAYIRKNSTNNALEFYNGTNWVEIITDYFPTGSTTLG